LSTAIQHENQTAGKNFPNLASGHMKMIFQQMMVGGTGLEPVTFRV
jgi:hypothetical protein